MITVETQHPVAEESLDHIHPEGVYIDNNLNSWWAINAENYFGAGEGGRRINFLDLGCAGGLLVRYMHDRGHLAVGLEGSDHCLNVRPEMIDEVGHLPNGHENWKILGNKNLFTCDVTKEYTVLDANKPIHFDLITCWDVIEHFDPEQIDDFFRLVDKHLAKDGVFVATIALNESGRAATSKNTPANLNYHRSLFPAAWWETKLAEYFDRIDYIKAFGDCVNRPTIGLIYAGTKKK